jgi:hypothetical protein
MKATITSASVDKNKLGQNRFVLTLQTSNGNEYFATTLSTPGAEPLTDSQLINLRISLGQLKASITSLMTVADPVRQIMIKRSTYVGTTVEIEVEEQKDRATGVVQRNAKGIAYKNVRLVPSHDDLTEEQVNALFGGSTGPTIHSEADVNATFES